MPKKTNRHVQRKVESKEAGFIGENFSKKDFISNELTRTMNKNEKIIMGILVGGIVVFLALSIILLFSKSKENVVGNVPTVTTDESEKKVNLTPYPTIPPIENTVIMMNTRRFNPADASIPKGGYIQFMNIDADPMTIEAGDDNSSVLNLGTIQPGEYKQVTFNSQGTFTFRNKNKTSEIGTVVIK